MVIIDCPPALGSLAITALAATHMAIVPTQCEFFSMQGIRSTLKLINTVRTKTNPHLDARLLVTMFDQRLGLHYLSLEHLRRTFKHTLFKTVIGVDSKVRESQMANQLLPKFATHSRAAAQYRQLTKELLKYAKN
jgi:chromosome partitioning protein